MAAVNFWSETNFAGTHLVLSTDTKMGLENSIFLNVESLIADANSWLVLWDLEKFTGNYLLVYQGSNIHNLALFPRGHEGVWTNHIRSLQIFSEQPSWWNSGVPPRG